MSKLVIDVSQFQGVIDWKKVSPQVSAAIIRLGYRGYGSAGTLTTDPRYKANMDGAISAGLPVGVYWCSQALSDAEALEEARYCISKLQGYKLTYPVLLDSETMAPNASGRADKIGKARRTQYGLTWARAMRDAGYIVGLYCSESWYTAEIDGYAFDDDGFDIWIAKYSQYAPKYRCDAWQFTSTARMDGISTNVDQNHVYKDYADRLRLQSMQSYDTVTLYTANKPGHGVRDTVAVVHPEAGGLYQEIAWSLILEPGAKMYHKLQKAVIL